MKFEEARADLPDAIYSRLHGKIESFLPPQEEAIKAGLFKDKSILVSAPTASGKTLVAEMAILTSVSKGKKAIYVAPMRALISEKFEDFRSAYPDIKSVLSTGDYNESDAFLRKYDVLFVSTEKLDSLLRNSTHDFANVGCIVYDEIHMLTDMDRGPTLEFLITLNRRIFPSAQIIGLSATINNAGDISKWLGCELVKSDFRPVKLVKKVYFDGELINGKRIKLRNVEDPLLNIVIELIKDRKQALVFAQTKKSTIASSKLISRVLYPTLSKDDKSALEKLSLEVLKALDRPTSQCEELSELIKAGVAFHHAGLVNKQRKLIEDGFRNGLIKFIVATPTLAMGVNLPANTVVISSIYRYGDFGSQPIPAMEAEQMLGRAGRPKYDTEGTAIIISRSERELEFVQEKYLVGELEPVLSKFNNEMAIRRYLLALVCLNIYNSEKDMAEFFDGLFLSTSGLDISDKVEDALEFLEANGFINRKDDRIVATRLGKLINSLYLDPYTGVIFIKFAEKLKKSGAADPFAVLHVLFCSEEFRFIRISRSEFEKYEEESYALGLMTDQNVVEYDRFISAIKMAHIMDDWMNEKNERYIEEEYRVPPGEFYSLLERMRWLVYSLKEISRTFGAKYNDISRLDIRLRYGIKEELVPLVSIPDIGRVRARKLYSAGIKTIAETKVASIDSLSRLLGRKIAEKVHRYLHREDSQQKLV